MDVEDGDVLHYDVVVIGAGPTGNMTARYAAKEGLDTLVIEKREEIGTPVRCGEGISLSWLEELDMEEKERWISSYMKGAVLYSPSGHQLRITEEMAGDEVGVVCERDKFDKEIASMAISEGADFMVKTSAQSLLKEDGKIAGVKASHMGEEFEIRADLVIGADGFESKVGRWAGIYDSVAPKDIMTCLQYRMVNIDVDPDYTHFYLGSDAPGGYAWIFPKGENSANVGLGIQFSRLSGERTPKDYLDEFIEKHEKISKGGIIDVVAGAVSVTSPPEKVITDGLMLVGDAARIVDPLTGGGIVNGMRQAKMAGETAVEAVKEGRTDEEFLQRYEDRWRDALGEKIWRNYMAKEKAMELDDEQFDKIISALSEIDFEKLSVGRILEGVKKKHPELVEEFEDMI